MLPKFAFAGLIFVLCLGFVCADEVKGKMTKIDDKGISMQGADGGEAKAYLFAKDCKFFKQVKKIKEEIKDGAKADEFKNPPKKKGLNVSLSTNDKNEVTEVLILAKKKALN